LSVEGQRRQGVQGRGDIHQARVGVDVHGQVDLAVPHRRLCRPRRHAALAQQRPEGVPQGVNVEHTPSVIPLDPGGFQVAVEDSRACPYIEDERFRW
jgi:hypothetical protein